MRRWDIFCRVVDNYGDVGFCWRLARQLADEHGAQVRIWIDQLQPLARLCPGIAMDTAQQQIGSIAIHHWSADFPLVEVAAVADVVIEAFACELPEPYVTAMAQRAQPPIWINLEYLSAEAWIEDCHLLASPHTKHSLTKFFFFPGFTSKTGGLLCERDLLATRAAFGPDAESAFWQSLGLSPRMNGELRVSLFCYDNPALPELLQCWSQSESPVLAMSTPGPATKQTAHWLGQSLVPGKPLQRGALTVHPLPFLPQPLYDRLLWACDINFVRGEDSFVRAQWAQKPFVWQIYPQTENAHLAKLEAFLARYLADFTAADAVRRFWSVWNGTGDVKSSWREFVAIHPILSRHAEAWALQLDRAGNLANNLSRFVRGE